MPLGSDDELVELAASLVPLAADACTIDVRADRSGTDTTCAAAAHVGGPARERALADEATRDEPGIRLAVPLVVDGIEGGVLTVWSAQPFGALAEAFVVATARHAADVVRRRAETRTERDAVLAYEALFALLGHEVRAPLQTLSIGIDLLRTRARDTADELPRQWVMDRCDQLGRSVDHLTALSDRLLDVTRIRAGRVPSQLVDAELGAIVENVLQRHAQQLEWAGCNFALKRPARIEGRWDVVHVDTIVSNLVTNALKYAAGCDLEIELSAAGDSATIAVRDHGPGIQGDVAPLFERFVRGRTRSSTSGLGVGLWVARSLASLQGGRIAFEPTEGGGATFVLTLPRFVTEAEAPSSRSSP